MALPTSARRAVFIAPDCDLESSSTNRMTSTTKSAANINFVERRSTACSSPLTAKNARPHF
jgi:hypothetical protein